jgi:predicted TIM-barrel fold metal-dependent hydrolase
MMQYNIILLFIFFLHGCSTLVTPIAGNFKDNPEDIYTAISPQARLLISNAFNGFESETLIDSHTHIIGLGAGGSGIWVNPTMLDGSDWVKRIKFSVYKSASGIQNEDRADEEYVERLLKLIKGIKPYNMKFFILAFDKHYTKSGAEDLSRTMFYVPNDYVVKLAQQYPDFFVPVISVNPYRKDALSELKKWHKQDVKFIKWLPNSQGINPGDKLIIPFYDKMIEYDMTLITHTGDEKAVEGDEYQHYGNPLHLTLPLTMGVKVIMAHLATLGNCEDFDNNMKIVPCFNLAMRLLNNKQYEKLLYADISAVTQSNRSSKLEEILDSTDLHHRFVNGSDYPLPAINILYKTSQLERMGFINDEQREQLNEIYSYNPILFDFVLKRTIKSPGKGNVFSRNAFRFSAEVN